MTITIIWFSSSRILLHQILSSFKSFAEIVSSMQKKWTGEISEFFHNWINHFINKIKVGQSHK